MPSNGSILINQEKKDSHLQQQHQQPKKEPLPSTSLRTSASDHTFPTGETGDDTATGKKRPRDHQQQQESPHRNKTMKSQEPSSTTTTTTMTSTSSTSTETSPASLSPQDIQGLRLEAIFHPKFDNEKRDQTKNSKNSKNDSNAVFETSSSKVRTAMLEKLNQNKGYLEVSLKHSGSLILWSGSQRYYSKNSCRNQFTQVAEILLRQHFCRAWWNENKDDADNYQEASSESKYKECSDYIEEHRLTLAFEVVTAVLGDHGDIPTQDFMILTAVADRQHERFYSTPELLQFCQRFRLPHNDVWTYDTPESSQKLFQLYDECRETGMAEDTVQALSQTADSYVPSMYPHVPFQGNILEGFIIRYIAYDEKDDNESSATSMSQLAKAAEHILKEVPPDRLPCFEMISSKIEDMPPALTADLRVLLQSIPFDYQLASSRSPGAAANEQSQQFQQKLAKILGQQNSDVDDSDDTRRLDLTKVTGGKLHLPSLVKRLLDDPNTDAETRRIVQLFQTLDGIKGVVNYSLFAMPSDQQDQPPRLFCMVHVMHDQTFFKFQRQQSDDGMPLFRGFCVELLSVRPPLACNGLNNGTPMITDACHTAQSSKDAADDKFLMLKMKLLPYMVRTFICRNLLRVLDKEGPEAFSSTAENLLDRWGISEQSTQKWMPFFNGWAQYVLENKNLDGPKMVKDKTTGKLVDLGPLTNFSYLRHLEHYTSLFESGKIKVNPASGVAANSSFQGVVCVVSENSEISKAIANCLAKEIGGDASDGTTGSVAVMSLTDAIKSKRTRSCVAYTELGEKIKGVKAFLNSQKVAKHLFLVFVGSDQEGLLDRFGGNGASSFFPALSQGDLKRIESVWTNVWKKQSCKTLFLLPCSAVAFESKAEDSSESIEATSTNELIDIAKGIQSESMDAAAAEQAKLSDPTQRGILVFFPGIPGSGKSSVVDSMEPQLQQEVSSRSDEIGSDRKVYVKEGDKVGGKKFWDLAENLLAGEGDPRPSLFIADKNAPPPSWPKIGQICGDSRALPLIVVPDDQTLNTTTVEGAITPEGVLQPYHSHFYPFSLKYLAVCLERVMSRPAGKHTGKLDSGLPTACMLVVQFFSFYRSNSADTLADNIISKLDDSGSSSAELLQPIEIPFLSADGRTQEIPEDLEKLLNESLQVRYGHDMGKKTKLSTTDEQMLDLEARLRACLEKHQELIRAWSAPLEESQAALTKQLFDRMSFLKKCGSLKGNISPEQLEISQISKKLKLVSLDVDSSQVQGALETLQQAGQIGEFLDIAHGHETDNHGGQKEPYPPPQFIVGTHVTMAFAGRKLSGKTLLQKFRHLQGREVSLKVTGFLWSKNHAAFSVKISTKTLSKDGAAEVEVPECENIFPHITVWCAPDTKAFYSNQLPGLVEAGEASKIAVSPEIDLTGTIAFWDHANKPFEI